MACIPFLALLYLICYPNLPPVDDTIAVRYPFLPKLNFNLLVILYQVAFDVVFSENVKLDPKKIPVFEQFLKISEILRHPGCPRLMRWRCSPTLSHFHVT